MNVNVTLIFGLENYKAVAEAYIAGLERLALKGPSAKGGHPVNRIASVASFFVSRVDSAVDKELEKKGAKNLLGKIAIANCKLAYAEYRRILGRPRWRELAAKGARPQRVLWASTSTKNPAYPDTLYVDELIGPDTVNTLPPETLKAFVDHGRPSETLTRDLADAQAAGSATGGARHRPGGGHPTAPGGRGGGLCQALPGPAGQHRRQAQAAFLIRGDVR